MRRLRLALACALLLGCGSAGGAPRACPLPPAGEHAAASAWPAADRLFHADERWLGGDAAVSVALGEERVLWLFGDSFVASAPGATRASAHFVRNSVAIQAGLDPSGAVMHFYAGAAPDGTPASFFPAEQEAWFWPGQGVVVDGELTLFLERIRADARAELGFRADGWTAVRVHEPSGDPPAWQLERLPTPDIAGFGEVGAAVVADGGYVYAFAVREPGDHAIGLVRWPRDAFARGELLQPESFQGSEHGFGSAAGSVLIAKGATEFSITRTSHGYLQVQSRGFGAAPIAIREAPALAGPWSAACDVYLPPEASRPGVLLYAARSHPELRASDGALVLTYASNTLEPKQLMGDLELYFPRFVRLGLR